MTIERFQALVLKLSNQMFVRCYYWLNYPQDRQIFGLQFPAAQEFGPTLEAELRGLGFESNRQDAIWTIARKESE